MTTSSAPMGRFVQGSLMRHVAVMSLAGSVGLAALFVVDLLNLLFIAMLGRPDLLAAVGYAGTVMFINSSFGIGMSIAASALVGRALGARDPALARRKGTTALILGVTGSAAFTAIVWASLAPILTFLGAQDAVHAEALSFLQIVVPSAPLVALAMMGGGIMRAHGAARRSILPTLTGAIAHGIFDPILIFWAGLDLTGAAMATVLSRVAMASMSIMMVRATMRGFHPPRLSELAADLRPMTGIALPAIITQMSTPIAMAIVTRLMATHGEAAMAGLAITARMTPVAFVVILSLNSSIGPIISQNLGAQLPERVRGTIRAGLVFSGIVTLVVSAILYLLRDPIADAFGATGITRELVLLFCGPISLLWYANAVIFVATAAFNNLDAPFTSTWTNWLRSTIGTWLPVWLLAELLGAPGVLWGQALSSVIFAILSWWLARRLLSRPLPQGH